MAMTRDELVKRVADINGIYYLVYDKSLNEITAGSQEGTIESLSLERLQAIEDKYRPATEQVKAVMANDPNAAANIQWYKKNKGVNWMTAWQKNYAPGSPSLNATWENAKAETADIVTPPPVTPPPADEGRSGFSKQDVSEYINKMYGPAYDEMIRTVTGAASQRGGLDTGGFQTSIAKGSALLEAQKAGMAIDWDKFLKSLELPTQQFEWQKNVQFPTLTGQWNKQFGLEENKYFSGIRNQEDWSRAYNDYFTSQQGSGSKWYDPLVTAIGYGLGGPIGGGIAKGATNLLSEIENDIFK